MSIPTSHDDLCDFFGAPHDANTVFFFSCVFKDPKTNKTRHGAISFADNNCLVPVMEQWFNVPINVSIGGRHMIAKIQPYSVTKGLDGYDELTGQVSCANETMNYSVMIC